MADLISPGLALTGFLSGMFLWVQITRWVGLLYVAASKEGGDFLGPPKRRLLWAAPFISLLHPTPWLIGAIAFFAYHAFRGAIDPGWTWFFGGVTVAVMFMATTTVAMIARWKHSASSQERGPNKSLERTREG